MASETQRLVKEFVSAEGVDQRYVLGRNEHSVALMKVIEVDGIIDDFAEPGTLWNGKPVLKGAQIPTQAIAVNCSMSISPVSAARRLVGLNINGSLSLADLCRAFPDRFPLPDFVRETREDLVQNATHWEHLAGALEDAESRQVLEDVLRYRVTGDPGVMQHYSVRLQDQYFEDFLQLVPGEVFVDAGGFDGDTTKEFCWRCPAYRKVYLFEPSSVNLQKARTRLNDLRNIQFLDVGLSDVEGVLSFNPDAGSASAVVAESTFQIRVSTLDCLVPEPVSFVKMDLEGWELKALAGSRRHILADHPKLAIAAYHHPSDFWRIFDFVRDVRSDYRVYLRHYTEGWSETVMFFVPNEIQVR